MQYEKKVESLDSPFFCIPNGPKICYSKKTGAIMGKIKSCTWSIMGIKPIARARRKEPGSTGSYGKE